MTDYHAILNHIPPALLVIVRIGGLMIYGPVLGAATIPARVRVFLSFIIGIACYPALSQQISHGPIELHVLTLAPMIAMELLIGLVIGFIASLPLLAMETGGLIMGQQMGLGFARFYNPAIDDESDILGQLLFFMALAGFLMIGGHEAMLLAVLNSFQHVDLGGFRPDADLLSLVCGLMLASLELALRVAAPLLALVFLETVAMGFLAKAVPQLNVLSLGFPLRILLALGVVAIGLIVIHDVAMDGIDEAFAALYAWMEQGGTGG